MFDSRKLSRSRMVWALMCLLTVPLYAQPAAPEFTPPGPVQLTEPVTVNFTDASKQRFRGKVHAYDMKGFEFQADGDAQRHTITWQTLPAEEVYVLHARLLRSDPEALQWYAAGAKLFTLENGATWSLKALDKAEYLAKRAHDSQMLKMINHAQAIARAKAIEQGQDLWGVLPEKINDQVVDKLKEQANQVRQKLGLNVKAYETEFFLLYTDLDANEAQQWYRLLDKMYHHMCRQFQIKRGTNIWFGKCVVWIFKDRRDYVNFETQIMGVDPNYAMASAGMNHASNKGPVYIGMFRQEDRKMFAHVLVHETGHGFLHRYRSNTQIPSWANEGLVEINAEKLVQSGLVEKRMRQSKEQMQARGETMGGDFFTRSHIDGWQYGVAAYFTYFLQQKNARSYKKLIDGIKDGLTVDQAFDQSYGQTKEQLVSEYGRRIGLRNLKP